MSRPTEWVACEFAKTVFCCQNKIEDRVTIGYFDGLHMIYGKGTFEFLKKYLHWPA